jgi:hypothetical protein
LVIFWLGDSEARHSVAVGSQSRGTVEIRLEPDEHDHVVYYAKIQAVCKRAACAVSLAESGAFVEVVKLLNDSQLSAWIRRKTVCTSYQYFSYRFHWRNSSAGCDICQKSPVETTVEKVEVVVVVVVDRIQVAQKAEALQLNLLSFSARSTLSNCRNFLVSSCVPLGMKLQDSSLPPALGEHLL